MERSWKFNADTMVCVMSLYLNRNCSPVTTSVQALETKLACMPGKCHVDVAFWGGVVPGNQHELVPMVKAGVVGFKCFLIHSGLDEFPNVSEADLHLAMTQMKGTNSVLLFHAELDSCGCTDVTGDVTKYETFLASRPREWEQDAIKLVCRLCLQYKVRCHIVHLSSGDAVPIIRQAQSEGAPLTVETCNHYLTLYAEEVPTGATEYKCAPPVREKSNQDVLWEAIGSGVIQTIVSDHSPCPPEMKNPETGNFMTAWGGISSLQFGLSLFWTGAKEKGFSLRQVQRLLCENTAALCHLDGSKGSIAVGKDADFVIWDPEATIMIETGMIQHRHKLTPYLNRPFYGVVHKTIVRGRIVYEANQPIPSASGQPILLQ
ncbi:PREDICTED: allantoinase, mitochondrial-like isoform X2 [Priapulus caudatus]|uniref:allantoinase n=1 Tax=Priapulus caudatus TaxID=37621 RepID=A0ABM1E0R5_PRICU|nr:PREDICTED: allantoinase, mitochondrial-like isoform X2 [Priapulus caudatus]